MQIYNEKILGFTNAKTPQQQQKHKHLNTCVHDYVSDVNAQTNIFLHEQTNVSEKKGFKIKEREKIK